MFDAPRFSENRIPGELRGTRHSVRYELSQKQVWRRSARDEQKLVGGPRKNSMEKLHYQTEYLPYFTHTTFGSILSGTLVFPFGYPKINGATAIYPSGAPISLRRFSSTRARWAPPIQQLPIPMDSAASIIVCAAIAQSY